MATEPSKSRPLHNFSFPELRWAQKNSSSHHRRESPDHPPARYNTPPRNNLEEGENGEEGKPWNLRPRKGGAKAAAVSKNENLVRVYDNSGNSKTDGTVNVAKSQRVRGGLLNGAKQSGLGLDRKEKRLWISLSREEIEEDIYSLTGSRPARRPRKWPRNVQKNLDSVFPGLYLVGVAADSYVVHDDPK